MTPRVALRCWLCALVLCAVAVGLCMVYVDRPLAEFLDAHVRHTELWVWLDHALRPFSVVVVAALFFLLGCGTWLISGRELPAWSETLILLSWSVTWAVAAEIIFKRTFGRGWPDPTFVRDHLYGFHFLHGQTYWDSFPSGTAIVSLALLSALWIVRPRRRAAGLVIVALLWTAVVLANYHWLSDMIAGGFLGVTIGWSTVRLLHPFVRRG